MTTLSERKHEQILRVMATILTAKETLQTGDPWHYGDTLAE